MAKCRSCGAEIVWAKTETGKSIPIDAEPVNEGNIHLKDGVAYVDKSCMGLPGPHYKSHFATCPHAAKHRKKEG